MMRPVARPRRSAQSANHLPTWTYDAERKQMVRVPLTGASVEPSAAEAPGELDQTDRAVVPSWPDAAAAEPPTTTRAVAEPQTAPTTEPATQPLPLPQTAPAEKPQVITKGLDEEDPFGWIKAARLDQIRVIAIDLNKLRNGDPKMNIVIRDRDAIVVPELQHGEFYLGGEFERPGVYSLTGRKVTLKQAIAAGANFSTLAWPRNGMLVRRIGKNQEQVIALDLEAIMRGEQQDLFLKPDDLIVVGSDPRALPLVIVRNAFRLTYGFGFIYDRNFADPAPFRMDSMRFKRW
jgi:pyruvate/2-oxoglutarate dehydrogenase complex dihydrolipoamide acyltransferase (E2) component